MNDSWGVETGSEVCRKTAAQKKQKKQNTRRLLSVNGKASAPFPNFLFSIYFSTSFCQTAASSSSLTLRSEVRTCQWSHHISTNDKKSLTLHYHRRCFSFPSPSPLWNLQLTELFFDSPNEVISYSECVRAPNVIGLIVSPHCLMSHFHVWTAAFRAEFSKGCQ
jgi:hypothetical protein